MLSNGYSGPKIGKMIIKIGANMAAPPMPLSMPVVATHKATGNMNQYNVQSNIEISISSKQKIAEGLLVSKSLNGVKASGFLGWIESKKYTYGGSKPEC